MGGLKEDLQPSTEAGFSDCASDSLQFSPTCFSGECSEHGCSDPMRHRGSICSSSGSSICEPESPMHQRRSSTFSDMAEDSVKDGSWNLVAYHVPWGPGYEGYEAGTLPGPDGTCVFLRSPTPLKRQRTPQACDKCRERKAKCSGSRPSCARCTDRGLSCVYSASPVISDAPLSPRALTRRLSVANSKEHLKLSARNRMRRKSSPALHDYAAESTNNNANLEIQPGSRPSISALSKLDIVDSWRNESFQKDLTAENGMEMSNGLDPSIIEFSGAQYDSGDLSQEFQTCGSPAFYVQPMSQLNSYRFPPPTVEDVNMLAADQLQNGSQSEIFSDNLASQHFDSTSECLLWNDVNSIFQSPGPDANFLGHLPPNFQGLDTTYAQDSLESIVEAQLGISPPVSFPNVSI